MRIDYRDYYFDCVFRQGMVSSCTAEALAMICYFTLRRDRHPVFVVSSLFIYYNTRTIMGTVDEDTGSTIPEALQALRVYGICPESMWPLSEDRVFQKPPDECYDFGRAVAVSSITIKPITDWDGIIASLSRRHLLLCSIIRTEGQMIDPATAFLRPRLDTPRRPYLHSVAIVGATDDAVIVMDSKGIDEGIKGFFYISRTDLFGVATDIYEIDMAITIPQPLPPIRSPCGLEHYYDAVVVGAGIAGAYTAYRLARIGRRVLVVDDGGFRSVGTLACFGSHHNITAYRFSPTAHPILSALVNDLGLPLADLPVINSMNRNQMRQPIFQRFIQKIMDEFGDTGVFTTSYRLNIFSRLQGLSTDDLMNRWGFSKSDHDNLMSTVSQYDPGFCFDSTDMPASYFITHILTSTVSDFVEIVGGFGRLIDACLQDFDSRPMPLIDPQQICGSDRLVLTNCRLGRGCAWDDRLLVLRPADSSSDLIIPVDGIEVFWTGRQATPPGCPPISSLRPMTLLFHFDSFLPESVPAYSHRPLWGRVFREDNHTIRVRSYNEQDSPRIMSCLIDAMPTIEYSLEGFPDLMNLLAIYPLTAGLNPSSFVMTCDGRYFGCSADMSAGVMATAARSDDRIHYIDSNYSTLYGWIEGALEMTDLAFVQYGI